MRAPRILIADDDCSLLKLYEAAFSARGYRVWTAQDGSQALDLVEKVRPDVLIDDIMMPNLHGLHVLDIIKGTPETSHTKVIMLSALDDTKLKEKSFKLGASDYIVKSQVTISEVLERVKKVLE